MINRRKLKLVAKERGISPHTLISQIVNNKLDDVDRLGIKEGIYATKISLATDANKSDIFYTILANKPHKPIIACQQIAAKITNLVINDNLEVYWREYRVGQLETNNRTFDNIIQQLVNMLENVY